MATSKANSTTLVFSVLLIMLCMPLVSMANAASDDVKTQVAPEDASNSTVDDGASYVPQGNSTTDSEGNPSLIQIRDNSTIGLDNDASTNEEAPSADEPNLIATETTPNNTPFIVAAITLATIAIGAAAIVALLRKR
jgi:hypothetical protein